MRELDLNNERVSFDARFSGIVYTIIVPIHTILAIYASENGRGMVFDSEDGDNGGGSGPEDTGMLKPDPNSKPKLRVVK